SRPLALASRHLSLFLVMPPPPPSSTLFPYTTLFRSDGDAIRVTLPVEESARVTRALAERGLYLTELRPEEVAQALGEFQEHGLRSEEHTSELQSRENLVCRLLLEKKKNNNIKAQYKN